MHWEKEEIAAIPSCSGLLCMFRFVVHDNGIQTTFPGPCLINNITLLTSSPKNLMMVLGKSILSKKMIIHRARKQNK